MSVKVEATKFGFKWLEKQNSTTVILCIVTVLTISSSYYFFTKYEELVQRFITEINKSNQRTIEIIEEKNRTCTAEKKEMHIDFVNQIDALVDVINK